MKVLITGMLAAVAMGPAIGFAADKAPDDEHIKALVKEVIRENPKLIIETLQKYQVEQKKQQQEKQLEASFKNRIEDTVAAHNPRKGPADAPVTIIEYTDFQCPYCARGAQTLDTVQKRYPDKVRVVFKNLPLKMHAQAEPAAKAALAAHKQGKFWEYHDLLFQNSSSLKDETYTKLAADLGLDVEQFNRDMASEEIAAQLKSDMDQAKALRFNGTPRFLVNGVQIKGAYPPDHFAMVIDRLLKEGT
jgi:protein-disulfide isomerase